jgi:hypothetical protein
MATFRKGSMQADVPHVVNFGNKLLISKVYTLAKDHWNYCSLNKRGEVLLMMIHIFLICLELLLEFISLFFVIVGCLSMLIIFFGPPFVPTPMRVIKDLTQIANISKDDVVIDLGSGDGRMLIYAARQGAMAKGWEINPLLVLWTRLAVRRYRVEKRVKVYLQSYYKADLSDATIVFLYNCPPYLPKLEQKLREELKTGTTIISYQFTCPTLTLTATPKPGIFIYTL